MAIHTTEETTETLSDGVKVYCKTWKPAQTSIALVLYLHGYSDHINRADFFFSSLADRGIELHGFDQRGWGRSVTCKADRGNTGPTRMIMNDISTMLKSLIALGHERNLPVFLMGHSMGGAEVLYYAAIGPADLRQHVRGYLSLAPYLTLHPDSEPSRALVLAARMAKMVAPKMQMVQKLKPDLVCRDPEVGRSWDLDALCHKTGTLECLGGMIDRGEELNIDAVQVKNARSVFLAHGTEDLITSYETSKKWLDRLDAPDKTMKTYEGFYHVLFCEPGDDKAIFSQDVGDWILARSEVKVNEEERSKL